MTRIRVAGTVDAAVALDFSLAVKEIQQQAQKANAPVPTQSDRLQEVIKKGLMHIRKKNAAQQ